MMDAVKSDYETLRSPRGNLSLESRKYLKDHFDRFDTLQKAVDGIEIGNVGGGVCSKPDRPNDSTPGLKSKPLLPPEQLMSQWKLITDVYVMGLRCDLFRFGNLQFGASSERWQVRGDYTMDGETINVDHPNEDHHEGLVPQRGGRQVRQS